MALVRGWMEKTFLIQKLLFHVNFWYQVRTYHSTGSVHNQNGSNNVVACAMLNRLRKLGTHHLYMQLNKQGRLRNVVPLI